MTDDRCGLLAVDLPRAEGLRLGKPDQEEILDASLRAKALSDPTRLLVAIALRDGGELCVCDLAWVCERWDKTVSHHALTLRRAGLAQSRREGKMVMYSLTEAGHELLEAVLSEPGVIA